MKSVQKIVTREERSVTQEFYSDSNQQGGATNGIPSIQSNQSQIQNSLLNNTFENMSLNNQQNQNQIQQQQNIQGQNLSQKKCTTTSKTSKTSINQTFSSSSSFDDATSFDGGFSPSPSPLAIRQDVTNNTSNNTNNSRKVVNTSNISKKSATVQRTNQQMSTDSLDDDNSSTNTSNFASPSPSPSVSRQDINLSNNSATTNTNRSQKVVNTSNVSKTTKINQQKIASDSSIDEAYNVTSPTLSPTSTRRDVQNNQNQRITDTSNTINTNTNTNVVTTLEDTLKSSPMKSCKVEEIWKVEETKYTMIISVGKEYGPEDVKITVKERIMSVVVKKEKFSQIDGSSLGFQGFGKSFTVPSDADFSGIKSTFTTEGNLRIEVSRITQTSKTTSTSTTTTTQQQQQQVQQQQQQQLQQQQQQQQNTSTNITKKAVNTSNTSNTTRNTNTSNTTNTNNESNNQIQQNSNVRNNTNTNTNTNNSRQTTDNSTSKNTATTLEEGLKTKPMKTCTLEEIWKVEETRYTMTISVGPDYGPEDVKITMKDSIMSVVVKKEKFSQFDGSSLGFAGFGKSFSVPHDADFQGIKSTFTADGNLRIEVPRIQ